MSTHSYPRLIEQFYDLQIRTNIRLYDSLDPGMREALLTLARLTWAGDIDCDANGAEFQRSHLVAEKLLESYGMTHRYVRSGS